MWSSDPAKGRAMGKDSGLPHGNLLVITVCGAFVAVIAAAIFLGASNPALLVIALILAARVLLALIKRIRVDEPWENHVPYSDVLHAPTRTTRRVSPSGGCAKEDDCLCGMLLNGPLH